MEQKRKDLVSKVKENVAVGRWWIEQTFDDTCKVFKYIHTGSKLAALISLKAPSIDAANSKEFSDIGTELAMQVAAMAPIAVSIDRLPSETVDKQKVIFLGQLKEMKKPEASWQKILDGKLNKWYSEVCLLKQESLLSPSKKSIEQLIKDQYVIDLYGELEIINFIRCQVGEDFLNKNSKKFSNDVLNMYGLI